MKKLLTTLAVVFLCAKMHPQAISAPQINVSGNVGCVGFPCLNSGALNFTADANQTMTALQTSANGGIKITSSVALTATRTLTVPAGNFQFMDIENATTGGQAVTICSASGGSCVTIPSASTAAGVWFDGTNFVVGSTGGGGSMVYPTGTGIAAVVSGSSWGTTYNASNTIPANFVSTLNQSTTGNAATATALAATPSQCSGSQFAQGVAANGNANCATPSGSGNTTSTSLTTNALPKANGANSIINSLASDNGTTLSYTGTGGISSPSGLTAGPDGVHAGIMSVYGNTANPTIPANEFGWLGFNAASATSYFFQPSTTAPAANQVMAVGAPSSGVVPVSYISNATTVSGVTCSLGSTCAPPLVCAGSASPCYLQQINPTTGATTTTTSSITTGATSVPVASCAGFTFAPGAIVVFENISQPEWTVATGCTGTTLTLSTRAYYGTAAGAWSSGTNVIQMTSGYSTSASTAPYFYTLANGAIGYNGSGNNLANQTAFNTSVTFLGGLVAGGGLVQLNGGTTTALYQPQATFYNGDSGGCYTGGPLYATLSGGTPWWAGVTGQSCTTGTNLIPPNVFALVPGGVSTAPTTGSIPALTVTTAGVVNVPTGGNFEINGVPIGGGGGCSTVTTLSGTTPVITATNCLQTITLSGNSTPTVTGITSGLTIGFEICQPSSGGPYTWTWPAAFHGAITIGTTANTCSIQSFTSFSGSTMVARDTGVINVAP